MEAPYFQSDTGLYRIKSCVRTPGSRLFSPIYSPQSFAHPSSMYTLPILRLKDVIGQLVPDATLDFVHEIPSTHIARLYTLNISGSRQLLLSLQPPLAARLLRNEQSLLLCETKLLYFLTKGSTCTIKKPPSQEDRNGRLLHSVIPKMLRHSSSTREMGYPYTIFEHVPGSTLSTQSSYLTASERRHIDNQIGTLVRDLALMTSPSGAFGPVVKVCSDPFNQGTSSDAGDEGATSWSLAFDSLMESILRDGEDMSVLVPYEIIRGQVSRLSWRLNAVTIPRLMLPDAGSDSVVLVERKFEDGLLSPEEAVRVTGLRHWSKGVFGDPLMSSCFENPSEAFSGGWKGDLIEDPEGANTRILLYRCYRAIVDIVTEYYRPRNESSRYEMDARKRLTDILAELEIVDLEGSQTPKRERTDSIQGADTIVMKKIKLEPVEE